MDDIGPGGRIAMRCPTLDLTILRHGVLPSCRNPFALTGAGADVSLTEFQADLIEHTSPIRIAAAPTGAGKTFAFELAPLIGLNVLFVVPTRRLAQNLKASVHETMVKEGWSDTKIERHLAIWTSDATTEKTSGGMSPADVRKERVQQLRGRKGFSETGTFIIATPESVASLLLTPPAAGGGQATMSLYDLATRDHIVFDEFHTIEAQGFGLAAALCKLTSGLSADDSMAQRPKVTFLSATPVDILPALEGFNVPRDEIICLSETVASWRPGKEPAGARLVHGDIEFLAGSYADVIDAVQQEGKAIARTLAARRAIIIIFDSVAKLKAHNDALSSIFRTHGVPSDKIMTINSIDDAHASGADENGIWGNQQDPRNASVILATSSVEMGVTFKASLMIMDPGHDACSFVQRIGRVSRGDLPGRVVVTRDGKLGTIPSLDRTLRQEKTSDTVKGNGIHVEDFIAATLRSTRESFTYTDGSADMKTFQQMSVRAVWCAALFWCALRRSWGVRAGERHLLKSHAPAKTWVIEKKLRTLENSSLEAPKTWVSAFIRQARRFREIESRIRVKHDGRTDHIAESMAGRYKEITGSPVFQDVDGAYLALQRPLKSILQGKDTRYYQATIDPLPPLDGLEIGTISTEWSAAMWRTRVKKGSNRFGAAGDAALDVSLDLVGMTHLIPVDAEDENDVQAFGGSGVL